MRDNATIASGGSNRALGRCRHAELVEGAWVSSKRWRESGAVESMMVSVAALTEAFASSKTVKVFHSFPAISREQLLWQQQ